MYYLLTHTIYDKIMLFLIITLLCTSKLQLLSAVLIGMVYISFYLLCLKFSVILSIYVLYSYPISDRTYFVRIGILAVIVSPTNTTFLILFMSAFMGSLFDHIYWLCFKDSLLSRMNRNQSQINQNPSNQENKIRHYIIMNKLLMNAFTTLAYIIVGLVGCMAKMSIT